MPFNDFERAPTELRIALAEKSDISQKNVAILDLWLRSPVCNRHAVASFDKITLAQYAAYKRKATWSDKPFIGKPDNYFFHGMHLTEMMYLLYQR